jgi:hypothetical protein
MDEMKDGQKIVSGGRTTCACGVGCNCGCGHSCMHRVLRWVVMIIILVIVFAIGMKAGEFRNALRNSYGGYYRGYPMMQGQVYNGGGVTVPVGVEGSATGTSASPMIPAQQ